MMRNLFYLSMMVIGLTCCKSKERMAVNISTEPVEMNTETVDETPVRKEAPAKVIEEKVTLKHGASIKKYCVIVGSFAEEQNAVNLRSKLINGDFPDCSIMLNDKGMYRVSAVCRDEENEARAILSRIRRDYAEFGDAWLLKSN